MAVTAIGNTGVAIFDSGFGHFFMSLYVL